MSDTLHTHKGSCLCQAVRFLAAAPKAASVGLCHCKMCRRWGGGLPLAGMHAQITLQADDTLKWWQSAPWGERGFCGACGSSIFWRSRAGAENNQWVVSVGALDDSEEISGIGDHIFYDDKAVFYELADSAPRTNGAEFIAAQLENIRKQGGEAYLQEALAQLRRYAGDARADEVEKLMAAE